MNSGGAAGENPCLCATEERRELIRVISGILCALLLCSALCYTEAETDLLARLIEAEAGGEEYEGKLAVGTVVMNRVEDGRWGDTVTRVIRAKGQFARPKRKASGDSVKAAKAVLDGERNLPSFVLFFQQAKVKRFYGEWYCTIGCHNFYGDGGGSRNITKILNIGKGC